MLPILRIFKTSLLYLAFLVFLFNQLVSPVLAQPATTTTGPSTTASTPYEYKEVKKEDWNIFEQSQWIIMSLGHTFICITGLSVIAGEKCIVLGAGGKIFGFNNSPEMGLFAYIDKAISAMYTHPPTSGTLYLANLGTNLGLVDEAYAQSIGGTGDRVLFPVIKLWQVARNVSYIAFILVFITIGLMIMFRQKISQQATVSAQAAIPGLVIGLVLITFSYFIAALIVDFSFITMKLDNLRAVFG